MAAPINVGSIMADLRVDSSHLERGLANGRRAIDAIHAELKRLHDELKGGYGIQLPEYQARVQALNNTLGPLIRAMEAGYAHARNLGSGLGIVNAQAGQFVGMHWGKAALGLQQVGAIVDDIQYSIQACVNNIGPLVQSFSAALGASNVMSLGIGAAAQVAVVAIYQLVQHWDLLMDKLGMSESTVVPAVDRIKLLTEAVKELNEEVKRGPEEGVVPALRRAEARLAEEKRAERAAKGMEDDRTEEQRQGDRRFTEAVGELGGIDALAEKLARTRLNRGGHLDAEGKYVPPDDRMEQYLSEKDRATYRKYSAVNPADYQDVVLPGGDRISAETLRKDRESLLRGLREKAFDNAVQAAKRDIGLATFNEAARNALGGEFLKHNPAPGPGDSEPDVAAGNLILGVTRTRRETREENKEKAKGAAEETRRRKEAEAQQLREIDEESQYYDDIDRENLRRWREAKQHAKQKAAEAKRQAAGAKRQAAEAKRQAAEAKRKRQENQDAAEDLIPAADDLAENLVGVFGKAGAVGKIMKALKDEGFRGDALQAAEGMAGDADRRLKDDIMKRALGGKFGEEPRQSEVFSGAALGDKVQSAVSNADDKKISLLEQIKDYQAQLLSAQLNQKHFGMRVAR